MSLSPQTKEHNRRVADLLDVRFGVRKDDKDTSGNWTREAIERYKNRFANGDLLTDSNDENDELFG